MTDSITTTTVEEEKEIIASMVGIHPVPIQDDHYYDYELEQRRFDRRNEIPQRLNF